MKPFIEFVDLAQGKAAGTDYKKIGKVPTESVFKHTGKHWKEWVGVLKRAGAATWTYQEIVAYLKTKQKLTPWWQQGVALGFEIAIGRRREGQDAKGKYMVTSTKSLACDVKAAWKFLVSHKGQGIWLKPLVETEMKPQAQFETRDGYFGEVRTVTLGRRARLRWQDPGRGGHTVVELLLVSRPGKKSILVFNHTGLPDAATRERLRGRWREAVDEIAGRIDEVPTLSGRGLARRPRR